MRFPIFARSATVLLCVGAVACGSSPELNTDGPGRDSGDDGSDSGDDGGTGDDGQDGLDGADGGDGGDDGSDGADGGVTPCGLAPCGRGQRCEESDGEAECVNLTCDELECDELEACAPAPGGGSFCKSIACESDVECALSEHCDGTKCVVDVCEPNAQSCSGDEVLVCSSNGGSEETAFSCQGGPYFESSCGETLRGVGCSCQDEWDCPAFTVCEAGRCVGTGHAPTCSLEPLDFDEVLPSRKFRWGGESVTSPAAAGRPFPSSAHVSSTPLVVNLDDDNGDGLVNELDFPEIVFLTYRTTDDVRYNGVIRAIHGGGARQGEDYFARCGDVLWSEGEPVSDDSACAFGTNTATRTAEPFALPGGTAAVGDIDGDGFPEIVVPTVRRSLLVLDNRGRVLLETPPWQWPGGPGQANASSWNFTTVALANLDHTGPAEAIVGNRVFTFRVEPNEEGVPRLVFDRRFVGTLRAGVQDGEFGSVVCPADVKRSRPGLELVAGSTAYGLPARPAGENPCDDPANAATNYCLGQLDVVWDTQQVFGKNTETGGVPDSQRDGFCAVADVLGETGVTPGPGAPLDGLPEVVLIANGHLVILDGDSGRQRVFRNLGGGTRGGAPNVDDFDGDGFPEIATALADFYTVIDLQAPEETNCPEWPTPIGKIEPSPGTNPSRAPGGQNAEGLCASDADCAAGAVCNLKAQACTCLHSGWKRIVEDDSSRATSSSVFDFNGDGAAEVAYNDECYFRVYDGATGGIYLGIPSLSRTVMENPTIADVDNDGNAEIVTVTNTDVLQCGETTLGYFPVPDDGPPTVARSELPNGLEVWGDRSDTWVAARRIWNQQAYHVTNVTESGLIPLHEPENYRPYNGRLYNSYRSQPRVYGVAPDLTLTAIFVSSPDVACGELSDVIDIAVEVKNQGDLRVGPGVVLGFFGEWDAPAFSGALEDDDGVPLQVVLDKSLEPGASLIVSARFLADNGPEGQLPSRVRVVVNGDGRERECDDANNSIEGPVDPGEALADLRLEFVSASGCAPGRAQVRIHNDGSLAAANILVRVFAGDPSQGGTSLGERVIAGPLEPGESEEVNVNLGNLGRSVVLHGWVDPLGAITECQKTNNQARGPGLTCGNSGPR